MARDITLEPINMGKNRGFARLARYMKKSDLMDETFFLTCENKFGVLKNDEAGPKRKRGKVLNLMCSSSQPYNHGRSKK